MSVCLLALHCGLGQHLAMSLHLHRWEDPAPCPALPFSLTLASLAAQTVNKLPAMQEIWVLFLGGDDPLETGMATHSMFLVWRIPRKEEPGGQWSRGSQRVGQD